MSKKIRFLLFFVVSVFFIFYIFKNTDKIDTDLRSLLEINIQKKDYEALQKVEKSLNSQIIFVSDNPKNFYLIKNLYTKFNIFNEINAGFSKDFTHFKDDLNSLKIASLDRKYILMLEQNKTIFFDNYIKSLFDITNISLLSKKDDFFNLSSQSSFLKNKSNFKPDIKTQMLKADYNGTSYYLATAILKDKYNAQSLLDFVKLAKEQKVNNSKLLIGGNALFMSQGRISGQHESSYMGIISLVLNLLLLWLGFKNYHVFNLFFVIVFSFLMGVSATIFFLGNIHILTLVISTSLIGLMLDFAMHWFSANLNKKIQPNSVFLLLRIFLIGLCITIGGYLIFLFSPMHFLHQISVMSIFTMLGSFLSTLFLLPYLVEEKIFSKSNIFESIFSKYINLISKIKKIKMIKFIVLIVCTIFCIVGVHKICNQNFNDNIKNYSKISDKFLSDITQISKISGEELSGKFIILNSENLIDDERFLVDDLLNNKAIENPLYLGEFINSKKEQEKIKSIFNESKNDNEIINKFKQLGFNENAVNKELSNITNLKSFSIEDIMKTSFKKHLDRFIIDDNTGIIYIGKVLNSDKLNEITTNHNDRYIDFANSVSEGFSKVKINAIYLKILAFVFAFIVLTLAFGFKKGFKYIFYIVFISILTLCIFANFGLEINIFTIFGIILASVVGTDYMIFANNKAMEYKERIFGIIMASITSIASFIVLIFSSTYVVFSFGLSVSIYILICAIIATMISY